MAAKNVASTQKKVKQDNITLVLQSFGRPSEYRRALLTILSFYAHCSLPKQHTQVLLFTDAPGFFASLLEDYPVSYQMLSPSTIQRMRGDIDFLHRIKIAVIESAFQLSSGILLYADSDTFFIKDPVTATSTVTANTCLMHVWEYRFSELANMKLPAGKTFHAFLSLLKKGEFSLSNGESIQVSPDDVSWNAGVMMFHPEHRKFIPDVYTLTNQFYPPTRNHASEQYAFSIVLQRALTIRPCNDVIYHYWYGIEKQVMDDFLLARWGEDQVRKQGASSKDVIRRWTGMLPSYLHNHILMQRDKAIQAFNADAYAEGYRWTFRSLMHLPWSAAFLRDVLYHTKRKLVL